MYINNRWHNEDLERTVKANVARAKERVAKEKKAKEIDRLNKFIYYWENQIAEWENG